MKVLCLDPSLRAFGWSIIDDSIPDILAGGCITTSNTSNTISTSDTKSLKLIAQTLKSVIDKYSPEKIIFEDSAGSKSNRASLALGYVKGLCVALSVSHGIEFETFKAKQTKKKITDSSSAKKEEILQEIRKFLPSFDQICANLPKFKVYAVSDSAAVFFN